MVPEKKNDGKIDAKKEENFLDLRDDPVKGVVLAGATEYAPNSVEEVMQLLYQGNKRRTTEATNANQTSSRSHAVFQVLFKNLQSRLL